MANKISKTKNPGVLGPGFFIGLMLLVISCPTTCVCSLQLHSPQQKSQKWLKSPKLHLLSAGGNRSNLFYHIIYPLYIFTINYHEKSPYFYGDLLLISVWSRIRFRPHCVRNRGCWMLPVPSGSTTWMYSHCPAKSSYRAAANGDPEVFSGVHYSRWP